MLAFVRKRIADHAAKHPSRVARWKRVEQTLLARLGAAPVATPKAKPAKAKAAKPAAKAKALDVDAILAATGLSVNDLLLAVAAKAQAA